MRKKDELSKEHTCMQHAHAEEMVFVLLSRDAAAPVAIRAWVAERLRLGKNTEADEQIVEALESAKVMESEGRKWAGQPPKKSVRDYLDAIVWDQKPRIDRWLIDYAAAPDTAYVRTVSRVVLVAAVRRARQPGCKFEVMLILEGPQGVGKSAALRVLAGEDEWFVDNLPLDTRALMEATAGKWIVEAGELRGMSSGDVAALKVCLTRQVDEARPAYQKEPMRVPRSFVIVGTTSETDYLRDVTGNRRLWPVRIVRFDLDRLRADRDQIWAEAAAAEAAGESIELGYTVIE